MRASIFVLCASLAAVAAALGACNSEDLTGHGCGVTGASTACGKTCGVDGDCGSGTYCGGDKTCTADCIQGSDACGQGRSCSNTGRCVTAAANDGGTPFDRDGACAVVSSQATLEKKPVDIIFVIDNSGSMADEIKSVQNNINTNFATIIAASGLDYRVIMLSKHGKADPDESICIDKPLSGNTTCNPPAANPVNTANFFQYSQEIGSHDSFQQIIATYNKADPSGASPTGWSAWLRPNAFKTFIEITDDESNMSAAEFETKLFALTPKNFGDATNRQYNFHSIVGLAENNPVTKPWQPTDPVQMQKCTGNGGDAVAPGTIYQGLSILTKGLRFAICQYNNFDAVFNAVAQGVVQTGQVACDFAVPASPSGGTISLDMIAVQYTPGNGGAVSYLGQASTSAACTSNAFYVDNGRIVLCPAACMTLRQDPTAKVGVLFVCESTIL